jgi:hypothetical protein
VDPYKVLENADWVIMVLEMRPLHFSFFDSAGLLAAGLTGAPFRTGTLIGFFAGVLMFAIRGDSPAS